MSPLAAGTCIGFHIDCGILVKGGLGVGMAFVLFIGSVLLLLSAVLGRKMGYLVLAVAFFGWMAIFSGLWVSGYFISQGPTTVKDLGPRGAEPAWVVEAAGTNVSSYPYQEYKDYPGGGWTTPSPGLSASVQSVTGAIQAYLADQANEEAGKSEFEPGAFQTTDFTVQDIKFDTSGKVSLAAAHAYYNSGGPLITLYLRHDSGSVPRYSWMFLAGSLLGLVIHLPFLDRVERKRKEILTGGTAPPWYGPA
ncbi:MAG TPA: hypothetical protein VE646_03955 [Actinomycetota bacterium]|nr:hypothetical protein [Actinomycetota bacterium]